MKPERQATFVIIPAYNEGSQITSVLEPLLNARYSVVVVDDGSTDNTWEILHTLAVHRLRHAINLGQGAALQTGTKYAVAQGAKYVIHFDADGQHRWQDIPVLMEPLLAGEADVVIGSRFLSADGRNSVPWAKRVVLRGGILVNGLLTGVWLSDAHNGFRALTSHAAKSIDLRENGYAHASEILAQCACKKLRYTERATTILYTQYSQRKGQSSWNALNILFDLLLRNMFK
jgi:glycosyltransferase involved in cell wall biosynthesis